jgi:dienelactone hydrolase
MHSEKLEYREGEVTFEAHLAWDGHSEGRRPAVVICHAFAGQSDNERTWAGELAGLGYVGVALDVYGKGVLGTTSQQCSALMAPLVDDRALLARRLEAGVAAVREHRVVDAGRMAAIGFCFGGLCAIDLARRGTDLRGVVAFHGLLIPPQVPNERIRASVLALHGHDDPMVEPAAVLAFEQEMTAAGADWQLHAFGGTVHAFTNARANDPARGTVYQPRSDRRARRIAKDFLAEVLA